MGRERVQNQSAQRSNLYAYVGNDPLDKADPSGETGECTGQVYKSPCPPQPAPGSGDQPEQLPPIVVTAQKSSPIIAAATLTGLATSEIGIGDLIVAGVAIYAVTHGSNTSSGNKGQASDAPAAGPPDPNDDNNNKDQTPASEKTAKDIAKRVEKDLWKDARRQFHDSKESGAGDRTLGQLNQDARDLYNEAGKEIPNWLK